MSERLTDGGPAFPMYNGPNCFSSPGMYLRDWFAGQALWGYMASGMSINAELVAQLSYAVADAMIAERDAEREKEA